MPRERIAADLAAVAAALEPASEAARKAHLFSLAGFYDWPKGWHDRLPIYERAVAELPEDILAETVEQAMLNCEFFPKPVELRRLIPGAFEHRRHLAQRMRVALLVCDRAARREERDRARG